MLIPAGMDVSPDGRHVAYVTNGMLMTVRVPDGAKEIETQLPLGAAAVAYSPDGKTLALDYAALEIRRASDLGSQTVLQHGGHWVAETITFSPDGSILASGGLGVGGSIIQLWDTRTWTQPESLRTALRLVTSLAFSRDGRHLYAGGVGVITVWDVARRSEIWHRNFGHSAGQFIAVSPDDQWLVTGKAPGSAMVLRARDGEIAWEWAAHDSNGVRTAAFSPDGHWLVTSGFQQAVRVWDFEEFLGARPR